MVDGTAIAAPERRWDAVLTPGTHVRLTSTMSLLLALALVAATAVPSFSQIPSWTSTPRGTRSSSVSGSPENDEEASSSAPSKAQRGAALAGRVRSVDRSSSTVTLEDGTVLRLPPDVQRLNEAALRDGVSVEAAYENQGGNNVVRDLRIIGR